MNTPLIIQDPSRLSWRKKLLALAPETLETPCYIYDLKAAQRHIQTLQTQLEDQADIYYAIKANPNTNILQLFARTAAGADISSIGELEQAKQAGFTLEKLSWAGPGKQSADISDALKKKIGIISVESIDELRRVNQCAEALQTCAKITLRINPQEVPRPFAMKMGGKPSPFGIVEEKMNEAILLAQSFSGIELKGFHIYSGTQCLEQKAIVENIASSLKLIENLSTAHQLHPEIVNLGGGFGIPLFDDDQTIDLENLARQIRNLLSETKAKFNSFSKTRFIFELGRYLIGAFGVYLAKAVEVKESREKCFVILNGGMHHFFAATGNFGQIIKRNYQIDNLSALSDKTRAIKTHEIVGPLCTPLDSMARNLQCPEIKAGDDIVFYNAGAYGLTASPVLFLGHQTPKEIIL